VDEYGYLEFGEWETGEDDGVCERNVEEEV
jgi:hypothetical protein